MKRLLAATATLFLLAAAAPAALAAPTNGACKAPKDAIVLKPGGKAFDQAVPTPVGALNSSPQEVGSFYLDLSGKPTGTRGKLTFTLSWDNPVSDYDLITNGSNDEATDNPEVKTVKAAHCKAVEVEVDVYAGLPIDQINLKVKGA